MRWFTWSLHENRVGKTNINPLQKGDIQCISKVMYANLTFAEQLAMTSSIFLNWHHCCLNLNALKRRTFRNLLNVCTIVSWKCLKNIFAGNKNILFVYSAQIQREGKQKICKVSVDKILKVSTQLPMSSCAVLPTANWTCARYIFAIPAQFSACLQLHT